MKTKTITKLFLTLLLFTAAVISGCGKNGSVVGPNSPNANLTFQISQRAGFNGGTEFLFKPSADVKISRIISIYAPQQFADTISYTNLNYVYSKDTVYIVNEYTGVQNGQQWNFSFTGSVPGQTNSGYNVTANYTVQ
jgi:hypothetical protein